MRKLSKDDQARVIAAHAIAEGDGTVMLAELSLMLDEHPQDYSWRSHLMRARRGFSQTPIKDGPGVLIGWTIEWDAAKADEPWEWWLEHKALMLSPSDRRTLQLLRAKLPTEHDVLDAIGTLHELRNNSKGTAVLMEVLIADDRSDNTFNALADSLRAARQAKTAAKVEAEENFRPVLISLYEQIGVRRNASTEEIKDARRRYAKVHHQAGQESAESAKIMEDSRALTFETHRRKYDASLARQEAVTAAAASRTEASRS